MKHCILIKWKDRQEAEKKYGEIRALFDGAVKIPGIAGVEYKRNCVDRENRYDLLILLDMEESALTAYDSSEMHQRWKREYGSLIASKAIFDFR